MPKPTYFVSGFPFEKINGLLGLDLEHDAVKVHKLLWKKIALKHPESLSVVEAYLDQALCKPEYVGQGPNHFNNIEVIVRTPAGALLVAVKIRDDKSFYCQPIIASAYLINQVTLWNRMKNGTLKKLK